MNKLSIAFLSSIVTAIFLFTFGLSFTAKNFNNLCQVNQKVNLILRTVNNGN